MTSKTNILKCAALALLLTNNLVRAQLPPDFPAFRITTSETNSVGDGYIFLTVTETSTNVGYYSMILRNDGTPVWYQRQTNIDCDLKLLPNGLLHHAPWYHTLSWTGGGDVYHQILDGDYNTVETISAGNGYLPESHDLEVLPNGNALVLSYYQSYMDLSRLVPGGYPNALVAGAVIQELNAHRNVVWQWRSWDHYTFQGYYAPVLSVMPGARNPVVDSFHLNTVTMDEDGNLLISNFMMDVEKINRQTGEVMWRLGGMGNQFSFVGVPPAQAMTHFSGHGLSRLPNGNILIFSNADQLATRSSKVYEYRLDETKKTATLVWSYSPATPYYSWHAGNAQRLPNGNTFIGWGGGGIVAGIGGLTNYQVPACTEVTPAGRVVFEMSFNDPLVASYRAFRFPYPTQSQGRTAFQAELTTGNSYDFADTGVSLEMTSGGGGYNSVAITREPYAPLYPVFIGKAPRVLPVRVKVFESAIDSLEANISFDVASFGFVHPSILTVYHRDSTSHGTFTAQETDFNPATGKLTTSVALDGIYGDLGEFIFGYPDIPEVAFPPILNAVESYCGIQTSEVIAPLAANPATTYAVNQELPIFLSWSPKGFATSYALQIATNQSFTTPLVDEGNLTNAFFVWSNATPNVAFFYRVKTSNNAGAADWSTGTFETTPPSLTVVTPNGGETWRRGLSYFVQWSDNIPANCKVELYKGGTFVRNLAASIPSTGALKWSIPSSLTPGSDYSIKISSLTNNAVADGSDFSFSIVDPPTIVPGSIVLPTGGPVRFDVSAPGASQVTILMSTDLKTWQTNGTVQMDADKGTFSDETTPVMGHRFYRLRVP
jgi:hypothetical protein